MFVILICNYNKQVYIYLNVYTKKEFITRKFSYRFIAAYLQYHKNAITLTA